MVNLIGFDIKRACLAVQETGAELALAATDIHLLALVTPPSSCGLCTRNRMPAVCGREETVAYTADGIGIKA
ncbi:hypothetical protein E5A73_18885 [Sphingomonas gei]|uniref:Uncharacterized protein n=1 Tax=Sphingomonas gei TaxID=1395960 RepID=A0A4S1X1J9_9SPHN|nr:hypothetical protein [Sphingomonas gei]TGX49583.1 hypothetical protein E5A73_18885 [Sphingomonas gei]